MDAAGLLADEARLEAHLHATGTLAANRDGVAVRQLASLHCIGALLLTHVHTLRRGRKESPRSVKIFIAYSVWPVCKTPSPESMTVPVARPEADDESTAWMATYMAGT